MTNISTPVKKCSLVLAQLLIACVPLSAQQHVFTNAERQDVVVQAVTNPCALTTANPVLSESISTDYTLHARPLGTVKAVMIFVDFPDVPGAESTQQIYDSIVPTGQAWMSAASYGRVQLAVTMFPKWYRMPRTADSYGYARGLTFASHKAYISDAVTSAAPDVAFANYDVTYVVAANTPAISFSPTFLARVGTGVPVNGGEVRLAVTFGSDSRIPNHYGSYVLDHETSHIFGLPDLYDFATGTFPDFLRFIGGWDIMSWVKPGANPLGWHSWKHGWVGDDQVACFQNGFGTATLTPMENAGGTKIAVVPTSTSEAIVAEVRTLSGLDANLCSAGVLLYRVNVNVATGAGPVKVIAALPDTDQASSQRCGPFYAAPFGSAGASTYSDSKSGLLFSFQSAGQGSYLLNVARSVPARKRVVKH